MTARTLRPFLFSLMLLSILAAGRGRSPVPPKADPERISAPGKIWLHHDLLLVNDQYRGIHVFSITNPAAPVRLSFVPITNTIDMAVYEDALYADSQGTLLVYSFTNPAAPVLVNRISNACTETWYYRMGLYEDDYYSDCGDGSMGCMAGDSEASSGSSSRGGSLARFAVKNGHLYTLKNWTMRVFLVSESGVSSPTNPYSLGEFNTGWDIETIYPWQDYLFLGGREGVYVYSVTDPASPKEIGRFVHARSWDPVVVQDPYAYVTLRDGWFDEGPRSRFEILALNNLSNMSVVRTIGMDGPYGLDVAGQYAYVCDGTSGLKIFDISDPTNMPAIPQQIIKPFDSYDVIVDADLMIGTGNGGVRLYSVTNALAPVLLKMLE